MPSIREKRELFVAALGEKKIPLPASGSNVDVIDALQEAYPALRDAGGFEYMYTDPGKKVLEIIPTGPRPTGNSVDYITQFIGQGKVYLRPIQSNIGPDDDTGEHVDKEAGIHSGQLEESCNNCFQFVPIHQLREHTQASRSEIFRTK